MKNVTSRDPRKPAILAALKAASNCRKITCVKETVTHFLGNAMNPNPGAVCRDGVSVERSAVPGAGVYDAGVLASAAAKTLTKIRAGQAVSARKDWMVLSRLVMDGALTSRMAPNGQLEFLHDGQPVLVGP